MMGYVSNGGDYVATNTDYRRIFICDNLKSHHSAYVNQMVYGRTGPCRSAIIPHPPYQPKWGPIEYKICDITHAISVDKDKRWTLDRREAAIHQKAQSIGPFNSTFEHCGYKWTQALTFSN